MKKQSGCFKKFRRSIRVRFLILIFGLFILVFTIVGSITVYTSTKLAYINLNNEAISYSELATRPLSEAYDLYFNSGYYKFEEIAANLLKLNNNLTNIEIIDVNGKVVFDSRFMQADKYNFEGQPPVVSSDVLNMVNKSKSTNEYLNANELKSIVVPYFTDWNSHPYSVRYFINYDQLKKENRILIYQSLIWMIILMSLSIWLLYYTTDRSIIHPIKEIINTAKAISSGNYGKRIKHESMDEIGELSLSVNQMAKTLEQDIVDLRELDKLKDEFVDIAAHNLKIPLTHLKYDIDYLLKNLASKINEKEKDLLKDIDVYSNKLQLLSEDLISVTSVKKGSLQNEIFTPVDLGNVVKKVIGELTDLANQKGLKINSSLIENAIVLGDEAKLSQVFSNLIDNAILYSNSSSKSIQVNLIEKKENYIVEIIDEGVGINSDELPKLFQKFYRAPSSAIYNKEGAGLGLHLAKLIVDVHHGNIWAESKEGSGSKFSVSLFKKSFFPAKVI